MDPCGWGIRYEDVVVVHITFLYSLLRRTEILRISDLWALAMHRLGGEPQYLNGHGRLLIDQRARAQALISGVTEIDKKRKSSEQCRWQINCNCPQINQLRKILHSSTGADTPMWIYCGPVQCELI